MKTSFRDTHSTTIDSLAAGDAFYPRCAPLHLYIKLHHGIKYHGKDIPYVSTEYPYSEMPLTRSFNAVDLGTGEPVYIDPTMEVEAPFIRITYK